MSSLEELFCSVDNSCQQFKPQWHKSLLGHGLPTRARKRSLGLSEVLSEVMTLLSGFHQSHYRNFKNFYLKQACRYWCQAFSWRVS